MTSMVRNSILINHSSNLNVCYKTIGGIECLYFDQTGYVNLETISAAQKELKGFEILKSDEKPIVVIDCLKVTDYDCQVRNLVQDILLEAKDKIGRIWVITSSLEIHAAMEILSFFTSKDIKVVSSKEQLNHNLQISQTFKKQVLSESQSKAS